LVASCSELQVYVIFIEDVQSSSPASWASIARRFVQLIHLTLANFRPNT
jgi:hypothetical protein